MTFPVIDLKDEKAKLFLVKTPPPFCKVFKTKSHTFQKVFLSIKVCNGEVSWLFKYQAKSLQIIGLQPIKVVAFSRS